LNVLEACIQQGVKRLVFSSSASVYGDAVEEPMTENHPLANTNFYGATKIAGEQLCRALYHRHKSYQYVGLRYMNVYGPRQDYRGAYVSVIMKVLDRIDAGLPPVVYGDGSQSYDFVHVSDCAAANVCAMKADVTDAFYNVGTGIKTSIREIAGMLLELTGADLEVRYEPGTTFVTSRVGSTEKAAAELGFRARVPLEDGLKDLIEWRRADRRAIASSSPKAGG
jgi:UDP-glucose 4-epimerase